MEPSGLVSRGTIGQQGCGHLSGDEEKQRPSEAGMLVGGQQREGTGKSPGQGLSHLVQSPLPTLRVHLSSKFECSEFMLGKIAFFMEDSASTQQ